MEQELPQELQVALYDFQRYLLDEVPPLTISDSIEELVRQPPELVMRPIHSWAIEMGRNQVPFVDALFHAIKKIHIFAALKLIERPIIDNYITALTPLALQACPPDERETLRTNLKSMSDSLTVTAPTMTSAASISKSRPKTQPAGGDNIVARSARRFSQIIDRLAKFIPGKGAAPAPPPQPGVPVDQPAAQLIALAATGASTDEELKQYIESLRPVTGGADTAALISMLAANAPQWEITPPPDTVLKPSAPVEAMHKIISLTKDSFESTKRLRELLFAAIEQFNSGALSVAVSMLEVADTVIVEKKVDPATMDRIRSDAIEGISAEQLKKYAENKGRHTLLRKALNFFPTLRLSSLFQDLRGEERAERRRSILSLLEAYGTMARDTARSELDAELEQGEKADTYYLRNLIYLMHRIPRDPEAAPEKELELLARSSAKGQSIYVIKEAVLPIGQIKTDAAVKLLTMRLAEFEAMLLKGDTTYPVDEMHKLLDRIVQALARIGTPAALLTVARHGLKPTAVLGDTRARLTVLAQHDLSFDEETVNLIIKMIRDDLPKKILGKVLPKLNPPVKLIESLSSTRSESVEALLGDLADKFADHDVGRAAQAAMAILSESGKTVGPDRKRATLTGDLQFFGLPSLMQSLADQQASGIVTLSGANGQTAGKLLFVGGKFAEAQAAHLRGADAVYQLLERPVVGTFAFVPQESSALKIKVEPISVMPLLLEGIRRHDEFKQHMTFVPDDLVLKATSVKPTPDAEETDPSVVREVWLRASGGGRVSEWEQQIPADAYRIRRLLAHWVDEGALQPAT